MKHFAKANKLFTKNIEIAMKANSLFLLIFALFLNVFDCSMSELHSQNKAKDTDKISAPYFLVKSGDSTVEGLPLLSTSFNANIAGTIAVPLLFAKSIRIPAKIQLKLNMCFPAQLVQLFMECGCTLAREFLMPKL